MINEYLTLIYLPSYIAKAKFSAVYTPYINPKLSTLMNILILNSILFATPLF
jgi:hypothetical protein